MGQDKGKKPWGGRFAERTADIVDRFNASVSFDQRLAPYDIAGSTAHARMLARQGIITYDDFHAIERGLTDIRLEIEEGRFVWDEALEDVHMNIEAKLTERIGQAGKKLHTARSRNDQVALDVRLFVRDHLDRVREKLLDFRRALFALARDNEAEVMPGYTHLQRAQPISVAHHLLAYEEMFARDDDRLGDCRRRVNVCPLGAGALAGTGFDIDPEYVAAELGFDGVFGNSMDAVSDRDFVVEFVGALSLVMIHLSRFSGELVLWSSSEFGFVDLGDAFCTGSSIMPQKKNPDVPELVRGKTGRVLGDLVSLLTMLKGLPLTYNKDLQEDKEALFDAVDTVEACLAVMTPLLGSMKFRADRLRRATREGFLTATDLADYLVGKGLPFREAHEIVGRAVALAIERGVGLEELDLKTLQSLTPLIDAKAGDVLDVEGAVARRGSPGGTAFDRVRAALLKTEKRLWPDE